jgi:hypothetical protein
MMVAEKIYETVQKLPERVQVQVLDFIEYLLIKAQQDATPEDQSIWASMSLDLAMRGMENEDTPEYTRADLREEFA